MQIEDTQAALIAELKLLTCEPEEVGRAKERYSSALRRLPKRAVAAIQGHRTWPRRGPAPAPTPPAARTTPPSPHSPPPSPPPSTPPRPSPPTSPPDTDDENSDDSHGSAIAPTAEAKPGATPPTKGPPSPPPSPPEPIARRLELLDAAEDAVRRTWAYPAYPENFLAEVEPHLARYVVSEGGRLRTAAVRAVYAALVRRNELCPAASDLEVCSTLSAPARTFRTWKKTIEALRAEAADGSALLDLAAPPPPSLPPSPPEATADPIETLADALAALQPAHDDALDAPGDDTPSRALDHALDAFMHALDEPAAQETTPPPRASTPRNEEALMFNGTLEEVEQGVYTIHLETAPTPASTPSDVAPRLTTPPSCAGARTKATTPATPDAQRWLSGAPMAWVRAPLLNILSKRRATPRATRPIAARRRRRAPLLAALGPMRHDRAHERRHSRTTLYQLLRRPHAAPRQQPRAAAPDDGAGCSTDPVVPHGKYDYGNEVVRYWDGLACCAELAPDPEGHGLGLRYTGTRPLPRGSLVGVYLADIKITARALRVWARHAPLLAEHAVESCGWALADTQGRCAISRVNESARPNLELAEVDMVPTGDAPSHTLMAMFTIATVQPGEWFYTDYGPDYDGVRRARGYTRPYDPERGAHEVPWLSSQELDGREAVVRDALSPQQLLTARAWGGVLDHEGKAGSASDTNRARGEPILHGRLPALAFESSQPRARPASPPGPEEDEPEEVEVELEIEDEATAAHEDAESRKRARSSPGPEPPPHAGEPTQAAERAVLASNTAVGSPDADTPCSAGGTPGERALATLYWEGRGPAPAGWDVIKLAAGSTRLVTASTVDIDGDDWGGTFDIHVTPPERAHEDDHPECQVRISVGQRRPRGAEEPALLVSWLSTVNNAPTVTTIAVDHPASQGFSSVKLRHGEMFAYGTPTPTWNGCTTMPIKQATSRLDWAFLLDIRSEPPLPYAPPGWPRCPPPCTPSHGALGRRLGGPTSPSHTATHPAHPPPGPGADGHPTPSNDGPPPSSPPPPSPPTSPPESDDEGEPDNGDARHAVEAPPGAAHAPPTDARRTASPSSEPPRCRFDGCKRPCYPRAAGTEDGGRGDWHDYCGRTHAQQAIAERRAHNPDAPRCARDGCERNAWRRSEHEGGGFHRCCGRRCEALLSASEAAAQPPPPALARAPRRAPAQADDNRPRTEEERQAGRQRLNTASSGPSPYVEKRGKGDEKRARGPRKRTPKRTAAASRLACRLADIAMATRRAGTSYATPLDETSARVGHEYVSDLIDELETITRGHAMAEVNKAFAPLRAAYDDHAWADMCQQREAVPPAPPPAPPEDTTVWAPCSLCGTHGAVALAPRTHGGCLCGGGLCTACGADTCACPWDGSSPAPPMPNAAARQRNSTELTFVDLPLGDPYAPTILLMGDASGEMAKACSLAFPAELCLAVDYRTRGHVAHGLYWCGDVRDVLWRQRWRLLIAHPDCASAALSNTTGRAGRIASGELWWAMAFAVMLYCAPAEIAIVEQPSSLLAQIWREPDTVMQYLDYGVGFSKKWCLWRRGGAHAFRAATPTTPGASAHATPTHRARNAERDEQKRQRSVTPPEMAAALCATINLRSDATWPQPRYDEEVARLAEGYRRHTGQEPPDGHDEPTAQPLRPPERRAPRAPRSEGRAANRQVNWIASLPLPPRGQAATSTACRATPQRRADKNDETKSHRGMHGTPPAPETDATADGDGAAGTATHAAHSQADTRAASPAHTGRPPGHEAKRTATQRGAFTNNATPKRGLEPEPAEHTLARQRRWRFDVPQGQVTAAQRDEHGTYAQGEPTGWRIDLAEAESPCTAGRHLLTYMPNDSARRYMGHVLAARRADPRADSATRPEASSLLAAMGFALPLPARIHALLENPGEADALAALDSLAQQVSEGHSLTLTERTPRALEGSVATPLAAWLRLRARVLREIDDRRAAAELRSRSSPAADGNADGAAAAADEAEAAWAALIGEEPDAHEIVHGGPTPETTAAESVGDPRHTPPTVDVDTALAPSERRIVLVAVTRHSDPEHGGARFLAYLPTRRNALYGVAEEIGKPRRRREAMCEDALSWLDLGCPHEAYFHAGDIQTHEEPRPAHREAGTPEPRDMRTIVFTAVLAHLPEGAQRADATATAPAPRKATDDGEWWTLDQLARAASSPAGVARYRAGAAAIAKVDSYMRPTGSAPHFVCWGVKPEANANDSAAEDAKAATGLHKRLCAAAAEASKFQTLLEKVHATGEGDGDGYAEWAHLLAPLVNTQPGEHLPHELLSFEPPAAPADAALRAFRHTAVIFATEPLPEPASQAPPEEGFWPHDVHDIVEDWALRRIDGWLADCLRWHRDGGPAHGRPQPIAFGEDAIKPKARGRVWDLREGPGRVKLFDPLTEPKRTGLDLDFARAEFADIADRELVSMICHGVQMKTDSMAHQIVLMPNLLSLYSENGGVAAAANQMAEMQKLGFLELFTKIPCVPFRAMPRGVVPKKGTDELRGIGDQGQPRKSLRTQRSGEPVVPLNELSREGGWSHQYMDSLETASHNSAVLLALADLNGESMVDMAFDFSKFFHQLFYYALMLWQMGAIVPRRGGPDGEGDALDFALEYVMTMGATPSSQVAQRFANAIAAAVYKRMNALEAARWQDPRLPNELTDAARSALAERAKLPHTCYGTQATMYNILIYCDDARLACVGAERAARLLRVFYDVVGKRGLRLPLSRAEKQQTGVGVVWLGAHLSSALGLVWVPRDKAARAAAALRAALRGELAVGEYRRLLGYLVSLLFMVGGDRRLLHHIFRPIKPGEELDSGPATLVVVDELMRAVLERWLALLMDVPGASMLAAFAPTDPPRNAPRHRIRADAALEGTPSPGLGGWLYGHWFAVALAEQPGLERLDIPHLELIAAGLAIITFSELLTGASLICIETDALATATSLTNRARTPAMQVILDALLASPSYNALAPRLRVAHCSGAGNPMADAASRGYANTLAALSEALGVTSTRMPISDEARAFMLRAIHGLRPINTARADRRPPRAQALEQRGGAGMGAARPLTEQERQAGRPHLNTASSGPSPYVAREPRDSAAPLTPTAARQTPPKAAPPRHGPHRDSSPRLHLGRVPPHATGAASPARTAIVPATPPWQRSHWQRALAASLASHQRTAADAAPKAATPQADGAHVTTQKHGANRTPPAYSPPHPKRERVVHVPATPSPTVRTQGEARPDARQDPPPRPATYGHAAPTRATTTGSRDHAGYATLYTPPGRDAATRGAPTRLDFQDEGSDVPKPPPDPATASWLHQRASGPCARVVSVPGGAITQRTAPATRELGGANARAMRADREGLVERAFAKLRDDKSEHAVRAPDDVKRWLAEVAVQGDPTQAPLTTQAQRGSNWNHWRKYCSYLGLSSPWRPDSATLDADGQQREAAIWAGALMWVFGRMQPRKGRFLPEGPPHYGKPKPPSPLSALAVLRGVRAEHVARGITPPSLALATRRAHEQMLKYSREIGPENCIPQRAIPMTHELICKLLSIPDGECILKGRKPWHWTTSYGLSTRTAFHVLSQCGFRKAEIALALGKWGPEKMSFASLLWLINGDVVKDPTPEQLRRLKKGDFAILMPGPSKADCFGMRWGNNPIWLPYDAEAAINAAYALAQWEIHAGVKHENRRLTPLFCGPEGVGTPLRAAALDDLFFRMMSYILRDEAQAKKYSIHGFRSYLASALLAAGCSGPEIQAALRWASDEALKIYQVVQRDTYGDWLIRAEQIKLTGARASSLHAEGKHLPVYEPENMVADALGTREELRNRAEHADNADIAIIRNLGVDGIVGEDDT